MSYQLMVIFHLVAILRFSSFRHKIVMMRKEDIYKAVGGHTFLIPVEEGFKVEIFGIVVRKLMNYLKLYTTQPPPRPDMIDRKVIDGHVIPNRVIFTAPAPLDDPQDTLAFEDNLKVTVTFFKHGEGKNAKGREVLWEWVARETMLYKIDSK